MGEFAADGQLRAVGNSSKQTARLMRNQADKKEQESMAEQGTTVKIEEVAGVDGVPITVLRFAGDITSTSQAAVLGTHEGLPENVKRILLDFSKVEYLNSSGIALVIQMMIAANKRRQEIQTFGLTKHFQKVFTMVGITKYTKLHVDEQTACDAFRS
jgi:anti-anti-sigma factor